MNGTNSLLIFAFSIPVIGVFVCLFMITMVLRGQSEFPFLQSIGCYGGTVLAFAVTYMMLDALYPGQMFKDRFKDIEAYYFSITTMATVGFGDIVPTHVVSRAIVMVQIFLGLIYNITIFAAVSAIISDRTLKIMREDAEDKERIFEKLRRDLERIKKGNESDDDGSS